MFNLDIRGYDAKAQKGHSDVKWYWNDRSSRGFNDGTLFPWDPPEPLPLEWRFDFRDPLTRLTYFEAKYGHYCGYIDARNNWKWANGLCRGPSTKALAFCKIRRGMEMTSIYIFSFRSIVIP